MRSSSRQVGLLLASEDPVALDAVAGALMGVPPQENPVLLAAQRRGWGATWAFLSRMVMAWAGQAFLQMPQPMHASGRILGVWAMRLRLARSTTPPV